MRLNIEGMSCAHCIMAVKKELGLVKGVTIENVEVGSAHVQLDSGVSLDQLKLAVEQAGYSLVSADEA